LTTAKKLQTNGKLKPSFRSGFEEKIYEQAIGRGHELEYEPLNPIIRYVVPARYIPDFQLANGIFIEAKGWLRPRDRAKMARVKRENPNLDIRFIFQRAKSRIGKSPSSLTYGEWATKNGFPWAEGTCIPEEWFS
jgi:Phage endonuclease I